MLLRLRGCRVTGPARQGTSHNLFRRNGSCPQQKHSVVQQTFLRACRSCSLTQSLPHCGSLSGALTQSLSLSLALSLSVCLPSVSLHHKLLHSLHS